MHLGKHELNCKIPHIYTQTQILRFLNLTYPDTGRAHNFLFLHGESLGFGFYSQEIKALIFLSYQSEIRKMKVYWAKRKVTLKKKKKKFIVGCFLIFFFLIILFVAEVGSA